MAFAEVLLLSPVEGLGAEGEQVKVRAGFARNCLLPRKLAVPVNRANKRQIEALQAARNAREAKEIQHARELVQQLERINIAIAVKTGEGGKMFGAVTAQDLLNRLAEDNIQIEKRRLSLQHPIKALGTHSVKLKLHAEVQYDLNFEVVSENPIEVAGD